jgi:hypothetical protein
MEWMEELLVTREELPAKTGSTAERLVTTVKNHFLQSHRDRLDPTQYHLTQPSHLNLTPILHLTQWHLVA